MLEMMLEKEWLCSHSKIMTRTSTHPQVNYWCKGFCNNEAYPSTKNAEKNLSMHQKGL
jgi:hypothetical protein